MEAFSDIDTFETDSTLSSKSSSEWFNLVGEECNDNDLDSFYELESDHFDSNWDSDEDEQKEIIVGEEVEDEEIKEMEKVFHANIYKPTRKYSIDFHFVPSILSKQMLYSLNYNIEQISKEVSADCIYSSKRTAKKMKIVSMVIRDQCRKASKETVQSMLKTRTMLMVQ